MSRPPLVLALRALAWAWAVFWVYGGVRSWPAGGGGLSPQEATAMAALMIANGLALAAAGQFILRGHDTVDGAAMVLFVANAVLSVTDQMGALDFVSLLVSILQRFGDV